MSILVLGTVALDTVKTPSGKRSQILGGSAVHFAMACRFFTEVNLVATVGSDFPVRYTRLLEEKGIILDSLIQVKAKTFRWSGEYHNDLNTAITKKTELGALADFLPSITKRQKAIEYVFLANFDPDIQRYFLDKMDSPRFVGLDSMNYWIHNRRKSLLRLLKKVNIYFCNDQEARELSNENNLIKAAKTLHKFGLSMILIKKAEHGSLFYCDDFIFCMPAYPIDCVVDPTGAGDSFSGGFMGYLAKINRLNRGSIGIAIAYGTIIASFNVEGFGIDCTSKLTLSKINTRLSQFRKNIVF